MTTDCRDIVFASLSTFGGSSLIRREVFFVLYRIFPDLAAEMMCEICLSQPEYFAFQPGDLEMLSMFFPSSTRHYSQCGNMKTWEKQVSWVYSKCYNEIIYVHI